MMVDGDGFRESLFFVKPKLRNPRGIRGYESDPNMP